MGQPVCRLLAPTWGEGKLSRHRHANRHVCLHLPCCVRCQTGNSRRSCPCALQVFHLLCLPLSCQTTPHSPVRWAGCLLRCPAMPCHAIPAFTAIPCPSSQCHAMPCHARDPNLSCTSGQTHCCTAKPHLRPPPAQRLLAQYRLRCPGSIRNDTCRLLGNLQVRSASQQWCMLPNLSGRQPGMHGRTHALPACSKSARLRTFCAQPASAGTPHCDLPAICRRSCKLPATRCPGAKALSGHQWAETPSTVRLAR